MAAPSKLLGAEHDRLLDGLSQTAVDYIKNYERLLCVIFGRQFQWGTNKCYILRKTLVDLWKEANRAQSI